MTSFLLDHLEATLAALKHTHITTANKIKETQGLLKEVDVFVMENQTLKEEIVKLRNQVDLPTKVQSHALTQEIQAQNRSLKEANQKLTKELQELKEASWTQVDQKDLEQGLSPLYDDPLRHEPEVKRTWDAWMKAREDLETQKRMDANTEELVKTVYKYRFEWMEAVRNSRLYPWYIYRVLIDVGERDMFYEVVREWRTGLNVDPMVWFGDLLKSEAIIPYTLANVIASKVHDSVRADMVAGRVSNVVEIYERPGYVIPLNWTLPLIQKICAITPTQMVVVHDTLEDVHLNARVMRVAPGASRDEK